jgi:hypothetical protein
MRKTFHPLGYEGVGIPSILEAPKVGDACDYEFTATSYLCTHQLYDLA